MRLQNKEWKKNLFIFWEQYQICNNHTYPNILIKNPTSFINKTSHLRNIDYFTQLALLNIILKFQKKLTDSRPSVIRTIFGKKICYDFATTPLSN